MLRRTSGAQSARWPNALMWTDDWWDRDSSWARQTAAATCGHMVRVGVAPRPSVGGVAPPLTVVCPLPPPACLQVDGAFNGTHDLAATGVSFNGCNVRHATPRHATPAWEPCSSVGLSRLADQPARALCHNSLICSASAAHARSPAPHAGILSHAGDRQQRALGDAPLRRQEPRRRLGRVRLRLRRARQLR